MGEVEIPYSELVNKYEKHQLLSCFYEFYPFLPDTKWFDEENLRSFLQKYRVVYIKPSQGTGGKGIIKVQLKKEEGKTRYVYQYRKRKRVYRKFVTLYRVACKRIDMLQAKRDRGKYLVQQGIELLKFEDCLFDVRVYVQLMQEENFECRGMLVRLGHPNKIVTNLSNSGRPMEFSEVFSAFATEEKVEELSRLLADISVNIAKTLRDNCPKVVEVGLDFGFDERLHPWLIEVNLEPRFKGFRKISEELFLQIQQRSKELRGMNEYEDEKMNQPLETKVEEWLHQSM